MPQYCAVPGCSTVGGGHRFPIDENVRKQWLDAIPRDNYTPSKYARVCKKHFNPDDYTFPKHSCTECVPIARLKPNAVPSRFCRNYEKERGKKIIRKKAESALQYPIKHETDTLSSNTEQNQCEEYFTFVGINEEDIDMETSNKDIKESSNDTVKLSEHDSNKSIVNIFHFENLKERADIVQFYTGYDNYEHVLFVFNLLGDDVNYSSECPLLAPAQGKLELTPLNQFYLTLIKLRRNMCNTELSFHFQISKTSVIRYFVKWIHFLFCKFKGMNLWAPKETIDENVTSPRKTNTCTVIIEAKIVKPKDHISHLATYSKKQSVNTLKVLIGISGSGCVTFVSNAYGGSVSDRELFEKCGIINLLQKGDIIVGDHDFNIQDLVSHMDVTVNMSQFPEKGSNQDTNQFTTSERISVQHVKSLICSDKAIGKIFKFLSNKLPSYLVPIGGKIIFVCFMLANFRKNINFGKK